MATRAALSDGPACGKEVHYVCVGGGRGAAAAWNTGLSFIRERFGDPWVAILDDDDRWTHDHVACCLEAAVRSDASGVISEITVVTPTGRITQPPPEMLRVEDFLRGNPGWQGSNTFIRARHLLDVGGFDEEFPSTLDRDLAVRVLMQEDVRWAFTGRHTVEYFIDPRIEALSTRADPKKLQGLRLFHSRYSGMMTEDVESAFLERAHRLFGAPRWMFPAFRRRDGEPRACAAREVLRQRTDRTLYGLGMGKEGVVLTDGHYVYKVFDNWRTEPDEVREERSARLHQLLDACRTSPWMPREALFDEEDTPVLRYRYEPSFSYDGGHREDVAALIRDLRKAGLMNLGYRPSSFRIVRGRLCLVDLGCDILPYDPARIRHNLERAYLMIAHCRRPDFKELQERARKGEELHELRGFNLFLTECGGLR